MKRFRHISKYNLLFLSLKEEFYSHADALVGITTDTTKMQETGALISKVPTTVIVILFVLGSFFPS